MKAPACSGRAPRCALHSLRSFQCLLRRTSRSMRPLSFPPFLLIGQSVREGMIVIIVDYFRIAPTPVTARTVNRYQSIYSQVHPMRLRPAVGHDSLQPVSIGSEFIFLLTLLISDCRFWDVFRRILNFFSSQYVDRSLRSLGWQIHLP